jgi:hypothetical protein
MKGREGRTMKFPDAILNSTLQRFLLLSSLPCLPPCFPSCLPCSNISVDFLHYGIKARNRLLQFAVNSGAKVAEKIKQPLQEKNP